MNYDIIDRARSLCVDIAGPADESDDNEVYGSIEVVDILSSEVLRLQADNAALRAKLENSALAAIRVQEDQVRPLAERVDISETENATLRKDIANYEHGTIEDCAARFDGLNKRDELLAPRKKTMDYEQLITSLQRDLDARDEECQGWREKANEMEDRATNAEREAVELRRSLRDLCDCFGGEPVGQGGAYNTDEYPCVIEARKLLSARTAIDSALLAKDKS